MRPPEETKTPHAMEFFFFFGSLYSYLAVMRIDALAARRLGIFGAPTFAVGKEIFWGDDRLEDALEYAAGMVPGAACSTTRNDAHSGH